MPPGSTSQYDYGDKREYDIPFSTIERSSNAYITNILHEWNLLEENGRNPATLTEFKRNLLSSIRPVKNPSFGVIDICGVKRLAMIRLKFSALNEHKFRHNFQCIHPMCACNTGIEDNDPMHNDLQGQLSYA